MIRTSSNILGGRSLSRKDSLKIAQVMQRKPGIKLVEDIKTTYVSSSEVKFAAKIAYDSLILKDQLIRKMNLDIAMAKMTNEEKDRLKILLRNSVDLLLTHTTEIVEDMEADVRKDFPQVQDIDLEFRVTRREEKPS